MTTAEWSSPPTLPLPLGDLEAAAGPPPRTPLEEHVAELERAEAHLVGRAHALAHGRDPDRSREVLTRLRHVRARLVEARADLARSSSRAR